MGAKSSHPAWWEDLQHWNPTLVRSGLNKARALRGLPALQAQPVPGSGGGSGAGSGAGGHAAAGPAGKHSPSNFRRRSIFEPPPPPAGAPGSSGGGSGGGGQSDADSATGPLHTSRSTHFSTPHRGAAEAPAGHGELTALDEEINLELARRREQKAGEEDQSVMLNKSELLQCFTEFTIVRDKAFHSLPLPIFDVLVAPGESRVDVREVVIVLLAGSDYESRGAADLVFDMFDHDRSNGLVMGELFNLVFVVCSVINKFGWATLPADDEIFADIVAQVTGVLLAQSGITRPEAIDLSRAEFHAATAPKIFSTTFLTTVQFFVDEAVDEGLQRGQTVALSDGTTRARRRMRTRSVSAALDHSSTSKSGPPPTSRLHHRRSSLEAAAAIDAAAIAAAAVAAHAESVKTKAHKTSLSSTQQPTIIQNIPRQRRRSSSSVSSAATQGQRQKSTVADVSLMSLAVFKARKRLLSSLELVRLIERTDYSPAELQALHSSFVQFAGAKAFLDRGSFIALIRHQYPVVEEVNARTHEHALGSLFRVIDIAGRGELNFKAFATGMCSFLRAGASRRVRMLFDVYNTSMNGEISLAELEAMFPAPQHPSNARLAEHFVTICTGYPGLIIPRHAFERICMNERLWFDVFMSSILPCADEAKGPFLLTQPRVSAFDMQMLQELWKRCEPMDSGRPGVSLPKFRVFMMEDFKCNPDVLPIVSRVFRLFDENGSGMLEWDELVSGFSRVLGGDLTKSIRFYFDLYDIDGSGVIQLNEVLQLILSAELAASNAEARAQKIMNAFDSDHNAEISFSEFEVAVRKNPELLQVFGAVFGPENTARTSASRRKKTDNTANRFTADVLKLTTLLLGRVKTKLRQRRESLSGDRDDSQAVVAQERVRRASLGELQGVIDVLQATTATPSKPVAPPPTTVGNEIKFTLPGLAPIQTHARAAFSFVDAAHVMMDTMTHAAGHTTPSSSNDHTTPSRETPASINGKLSPAHVINHSAAAQTHAVTVSAILRDSESRRRRPSLIDQERPRQSTEVAVMAPEIMMAAQVASRERGRKLSTSLEKGSQALKYDMMRSDFQIGELGHTRSSDGTAGKHQITVHLPGDMDGSRQTVHVPRALQPLNDADFGLPTDHSHSTGGRRKAGSRSHSRPSSAAGPESPPMPVLDIGTVAAAADSVHGAPLSPPAPTISIASPSWIGTSHVARPNTMAARRRASQEFMPESAIAQETAEAARPLVTQLVQPTSYERSELDVFTAMKAEEALVKKRSKRKLLALPKVSRLGPVTKNLRPVKSSGTLSRSMPRPNSRSSMSQSTMQMPLLMTASTSSLSSFARYLPPPTAPSMPRTHPGVNLSIAGTPSPLINPLDRIVGW